MNLRIVGLVRDFELQRDLRKELLRKWAHADKAASTHSFHSCHRCHAQKIKCSGEKPCSKCRAAGYEGQCIYATRDRKIRVDER
jgi:late competence protein required for DNA uptake (superfamily II DNA/RNA helicase)